MSKPLNPPKATGAGQRELPAYLSNGVIGLRVRPNPLASGMALLSGYSGLHPERLIEAAAVAPYPLAADIAIDGTWMSDVPQRCRPLEQSYDFASGELSSRLAFKSGTATATIDVLTFCCRHEPSLAVQEITLTADAACDVRLRAFVDGRGVGGRLVHRALKTPAQDSRDFDGSISWESDGAYSRCGIAYATDLTGASATPDRSAEQVMTTEHAFRLRADRRIHLRQIVSMVPSVLHTQPDRQAERLVAMGAHYGTARLRAANRAAWEELWKGRILLHGADQRWQALADAAFFYLNTSVHVGSPASTSIFGLATWHDYHYYYGHVMWDIETFCIPPLALLQPHAAEAMVEYRLRMAPAARANAQMQGRAGLQFPWESAPRSGDEATPSPGKPAWHEDHVSFDVALALMHYAHATGDMNFLEEKAWPVLAGVARWIESRVRRTRRGYEIPGAMGIAERKHASDNDAFTVMAAQNVLKHALETARRFGKTPRPAWEDILRGLVVPTRDGMVLPHEGYRSNEEKGATPSPLMGAFPLWNERFQQEQKKTFDYFFDRADDYIGSPMLSALYGVWAAWQGKRALSEKFLDEGYAQFISGRFLQTLEYRHDKFPEQPMAGPFFANLGGFLMSLIMGFPGLRITASGFETWPDRNVILPRGWRAIEIERMWAQGQPVSLVAEQGAKRAILRAAR